MKARHSVELRNMRRLHKEKSASLPPLAVRVVGIAITLVYLLVSSLIHCQHTCHCHCGFSCSCGCPTATGDDGLSPNLPGKHSCCIPLRLEEKAGPSSACRNCHSGKPEPAPSPGGKDDCPACRYLNAALASGVPLPVMMPTTAPHAAPFAEPLAASVLGSPIRPAARAPPAA
jgi:hypothetical protein